MRRGEPSALLGLLRCPVAKVAIWRGTRARSSAARLSPWAERRESDRAPQQLLRQTRGIRLRGPRARRRSLRLSGDFAGDEWGKLVRCAAHRELAWPRDPRRENRRSASVKGYGNAARSGVSPSALPRGVFRATQGRLPGVTKSRGPRRLQPDPRFGLQTIPPATYGFIRPSKAEECFTIQPE